MAETAIAAVLSKFGELAVTEAKVLAQVGDDMMLLRDRLEWLQAFIRDADRKSRAGTDGLTHVWVHQTRDVAFEAEDALDEFFYKGVFLGGRDREEELEEARLVNTHMPHAMLAGAGGCRVVYVCREPKDMAVSMWHYLRTVHPELSLSDTVDAVCDGTTRSGPFWDHALGYWRAAAARPDKVLFLRYEELLRDPAGNARRLARFVGQPFSEAEEEAGVVGDVVRLCSLENLRSLEVNKTGIVGPLLKTPRKALFRKGVAGDWANHLTPEMARRIDDVVADKLRGTGLTFQL